MAVADGVNRLGRPRASAPARTLASRTGALPAAELQELAGGVFHEGEAHRGFDHRFARQGAEGVALAAGVTAVGELEQGLGELAPQAGFAPLLVEHGLGGLAGKGHGF